jgi:hypothetical protein
MSIATEVATAESAEREDELLKLVHPRPWNWIAIGGNASGAHHIYLVDANDRKIAALWGKAEEKVAAVKLIIKLINEAGPF